jgi:hypothetical protein
VPIFLKWTFACADKPNIAGNGHGARERFLEDERHDFFELQKNQILNFNFFKKIPECTL